MDDRELFRFKPGYAPLAVAPYSTGRNGVVSRALLRCVTTTAPAARQCGCQPSVLSVTHDEQHLTRYAPTRYVNVVGQLGADALVSDEMETMALCVGCEGCKRECPTGATWPR